MAVARQVAGRSKHLTRATEEGTATPGRTRTAAPSEEGCSPL